MVKQKSKNKWLAGLAAVAICGAGTAWDAGAVSINGEIHFAGLAQTDSGDLANATELQFFNPVSILLKTGDFALDTSTSATFTDLTFSPFTPVADLWETSEFQFSITGITEIDQDATTLDIEGVGYASLSAGSGLVDYVPTVGTFRFTSNGTGSTFSFSSDVAVPEGGATLVLLGFAMTGLVLVRRKLGLCQA